MKHPRISVEQEKSDVRLTCPESMGGGIAQRGFEFQANYALSLLPDLLGDDTESVKFAAMLIEGSGDIDVKFADASGNTSRLYIQVKNHKISKPDFVQIIQEQFYKLARSDPYTYNRYWIVADGLSQSLTQLQTKLQRLQGTEGFFDDRSEIVKQTIEDIKKSLPSEIANSESMVDFVARRVRLDIYAREAREEHQVGNKLVSFLMANRGLSQPDARACYLDLANIVRTSAQKILKRERIEQVIQQYRQAEVLSDPERGGLTGPGVAALFPPGSWRLCYHDWDSIKGSLKSVCSTTLDADLLRKLLDQVLELLEEANSPGAVSRLWSSWKEETRNRVLALAAFQSSNKVVSALYRQAVDLLDGQLVAAAELLCRSRKWESASFVASLATALDPARGSAIKIKILAESKFDETQKTLERMYINARKALNAGRVRDAEQILLSILREDPYYCDAKLLLKQIRRSK